jgi:hypothetical protein
MEAASEISLDRRADGSEGQLTPCLFSSQTSVTASTDTRSAMRDNGDGLSTEAR